VPCRRGLSRRALPTAARHPPSGPEWLIEIKHDGFRLIARKEGKRVRLTHRFPLIVEALAKLRLRSRIIDDGRMLRSDVEDWLFEKETQASKKIIQLQEDTLRWAKLAAWIGVVGILVAIVIAVLGR
jgi:ATP-dependent DNA ligase